MVRHKSAGDITVNCINPGMTATDVFRGPQAVFKCMMLIAAIVVVSCLLHRKNAFCINEPPHDKINKVTVRPSEDSDQPGLIRVFAVRLKKAKILSYPLSAQRRL